MVRIANGGNVRIQIWREAALLLAFCYNAAEKVLLTISRL